MTNRGGRIPDGDAGMTDLAAAPRGMPVAMRSRLAVAAGLAALGIALLSIDLQVAAWCRTRRLPGDLGRLLDLSEVFAHGLSVAVILAVTVSLDPVLRRAAGRAAAGWDIVRLFGAAYAGGIVVDLVKAAVTRVRPRAADLTAVASVFDTFGVSAAATAVTGGGLAGKPADLMSFPSGHAAVAAGLATALAWKYPHATPTFALLAALAAAQRVASAAHYPSDTAFGAAIGVAVAAVCLGGSRPAVAEGKRVL
jgi:membrane-associated phospholipid phosphatase